MKRGGRVEGQEMEEGGQEKKVKDGRKEVEKKDGLRKARKGRKI